MGLAERVRAGVVRLLDLAAEVVRIDQILSVAGR